MWFLVARPLLASVQGERRDLVCYKQWMRAAIPYIAVLIAIGIAIWFAVGNPLQP
jgi:hypothetical protein